MDRNEYPKVLVISRAFRAGDAITILNLFEGWHQDKLFCVSGVNSSFLKRFKSSYILGDKEKRFTKPFGLFKKESPSFVLDCNGDGFVDQPIPKNNALYRIFIKKVLMLFDLYEGRVKINLSEELSAWIKLVNPDVIYTSIGDMETGNLLLQINNSFPDIKIVTHCFDDWITPSYRMLQKKRHVRKAERLLKGVLDKAVLHIATTEKMAKEYYKRYGYNFITFFNPISLINENASISFDTIKFHIIYVGKIGMHNAQAISDMINAIHSFNIMSKRQVVLDIYSGNDINELINFGIKPEKFVSIHKPIPNKDIPDLLAKSHALFLPISITKAAADFARFSMSTKMGEYMASKRPILYYGPEDIAITDLVKEENIAICVSRRNKEDMVNAIENVLSCNDSVKSMVERAFQLACKKFDKKVVCDQFQSQIKQLII